MEGLVAAILLVGGGLTALQAATVLAGLPFSLLLVVLCFSFFKSVRAYYGSNYKV